MESHAKRRKYLARRGIKVIMGGGSNFFGPKIIVPKLYLKLEFDTEDQVLF